MSRKILIDSNSLLDYIRKDVDFPIGREMAETIIEDEPEVEAIPVSWIEKEIAEGVEGFDRYSSFVQLMLDRWENENEQR